MPRSQRMCADCVQILAEKGVRVLSINPPNDGREMNADAVAATLIDAIRQAQSSPDAVPAEISAE